VSRYSSLLFYCLCTSYALLLCVALRVSFASRVSLLSASLPLWYVPLVCYSPGLLYAYVCLYRYPLSTGLVGGSFYLCVLAIWVSSLLSVGFFLCTFPLCVYGHTLFSLWVACICFCGAGYASSLLYTAVGDTLFVLSACTGLLRLWWGIWLFCVLGIYSVCCVLSLGGLVAFFWLVLRTRLCWGSTLFTTIPIAEPRKRSEGGCSIK